MFGIGAIVLGVIALLVAMSAGSRAHELAERVRVLEERAAGGPNVFVAPVSGNESAGTPGG
jgi:hypothetical protein